VNPLALILWPMCPSFGRCGIVEKASPEFQEGWGSRKSGARGLRFHPCDPPEWFARCAHAGFLGTIRNTGKRGANRSNSASGASLSIGMCALALVARFR
jgi:hypothetical protein